MSWLQLPPVDALLVPGYTPLGARQPILLHPRAVRRLRRAKQLAKRLGTRWIVVSGAAVYPEGTPFVEAEQMAAWLNDAGWPAERTLIEPHARHTHTNLRNAGRLLLERSIGEALVVSDLLQSFYIGSPERSGLAARSRRELGYFPGEVRRLRPRVTLFRPAEDVFRAGPDPRDP